MAYMSCINLTCVHIPCTSRTATSVSNITLLYRAKHWIDELLLAIEPYTVSVDV